jgi:preprotein translocase subunit YajC
MLLSATIAVVGLAGGLCWAQQTQKADDKSAQPNLVPLPTEKVGPGGAPVGGVKTGVEATGGSAASQTSGAKVGTGATTKPDAGIFGGGMGFYVVLLGGFVLLYFWMGRSRRKQESKRKEMLSNLKKNDKIVTIGGIIGTVVEAKPDEITIKVDESSNVRMKFARWAVRGAAADAAQEPEGKK